MRTPVLRLSSYDGASLLLLLLSGNCRSARPSLRIGVGNVTRSLVQRDLVGDEIGLPKLQNLFRGTSRYSNAILLLRNMCPSQLKSTEVSGDYNKAQSQVDFIQVYHDGPGTSFPHNITQHDLLQGH